jgi:hypothetical protein
MRLLVAAGGAAASADTVPPSIRGLVEGASEILVIAPMLPSRFEWLASATDNARERADERLRRVLSHMDEMNASAQGTVGADDPLLAFDEAIADFSPDHILIALRDANRADWQERGLLDGLLQRFAMPVTVFVVAE